MQIKNKLHLAIKGIFNYLVISDLHIPFHHPDTIAFIKFLIKRFKIKITFQSGDILDGYFMSRYGKDPYAMSAAKEIELSQIFLDKLEKVLPELYITLGNHTAGRAASKLSDAQIPMDVGLFLDGVYGGLPKGWNWCNDLILNKKTLITHSIGNPKEDKFIHINKMNIITGHLHSDSMIRWVMSNGTLHYRASVGCLIDKHQKAFKYHKKDWRDIVLSCLVVVDGLPIMYPMIVDKHNRWVGY